MYFVDLSVEMTQHVLYCSDPEMETVELSEQTVNPGQLKTGPADFELLKVLGKGGYGKVCIMIRLS